MRRLVVHSQRGLGRPGGVAIATATSGTSQWARDRSGVPSAPDLGTVLAVASHELQTPTTVIKAEAQLLLRRLGAGNAAGQDVEEGLTMIADQADRLARLISLLLDLSRFEAGALQLERAPTDLTQLVSAVATALQVTTDRHRFDVVAPRPVVGNWDARRLEEVVTNLLSNAIRYSPAGGTIEVCVRISQAEATVRVRDRGVGILAEDLPRVFERFYRGRAGRRPDSVGLGLSICQAMVAAHGGHIWAESEGLGHGSTFTFTLPLGFQQ